MMSDEQIKVMLSGLATSHFDFVGSASPQKEKE